MKVLLHHINAGGYLMHLKFLVQALAKEYPEDTYYVLCMESSELTTLGEIPNVRIIALKKQLHLEWTRFRMALGGVARIAREHQVDLIWSINIGLYRRSGIPQLLSLRNAYQVYPWKVARYHPDSQFRTAMLRLFFRRSLCVSDAVVTQTPLMAKCVSAISQAPSLVFVVPKAVETTAEVTFEPLPPPVSCLLEGGLGSSAFTFFYAAACDPHKNHLTLISCLEILRREGVRTRVGVTVSRDELLAKLGPGVRDLINSGYLLPFGSISKQHLRPLYQRCDACLMPSLLESLSSAHLEAMQWGKPQIVADLPYAHDLCGEAAVYAQPEDPADWAERIRQLMADSELRERLVRAGRHQMESYPKSWRENARQFHECLVKTVQTRR